MKERLQKIMARAGLGSRRGCEKLIVRGEVMVNGKIATVGMKVDPAKDRIEFNGQLIDPPEALKYIALYKPRGVISSAKAQDDRKIVRDLVDEPGHLYPVGRLDVDSEGLILMTNDGELTNRLTHPRFGHEKEYKVLVTRRPDARQLTAWKNGVVLEDGQRTAPARVRVLSNHDKGSWLRVILREGRNRQLREMGQLTGLPVHKIIRVRIGTLLLGKLKPRQWRYLNAKEIEDLKSSKAYNPRSHGNKRR
ncbi:MAG: rRNA pseudouridine synthase [Anaerolineae bacterium]|nr:rRNA pseudouridine synthase [Anaerolineae bacterium]